MDPMNDDEDGTSPDSGDRIQDFWNRHGGPATVQSKHEETVPGMSGWSEVYAADGYALRCDWSKMGSKQEMQYVERPPPS